MEAFENIVSVHVETNFTKPVNLTFLVYNFGV